MIERDNSLINSYRRRAAGLLVPVVAVLSAAMAEPASAKPKPTPETRTYHGEIETAGDGEWVIDCYGSRKVRVRVGETLSGLVAKHTLVVQPGAMDDTNIPPEAIHEAVADMNNLEDPNLIFAGKKIILPKQCQTGIVR